ncbi:MAG: hypothetical protein PW843_26240 [Azospirillaceae bacterium]|nr:hypothetical protein [Azospirillaceae bacterium]
MTMAARPRRQPRPAGTVAPAASAYMAKSAMVSTARGTVITRLRQLRAMMTWRAAMTPRVAGKAASTIAARAGGTVTTRPARASRRPASHRATSRASGRPRRGGRPVQLGTAVRMNPATAAMTKPNSISWMCQASGSSPAGPVSAPDSSATHRASAMAAQDEAARKNGRKPSASRDGPV